MEKTNKFSITISRQLGCGGAYIGQQLAKKLDIFYADREIIDRVARQYAVLEEDVAQNDEKIFSFWQSFLQFNTIATDLYVPPKLLAPTDKELFQAEAEIIEHIADERSAVIIGRCGSYILRDYPNNVKVFLHGDMESRRKRVQSLYQVSEESAEIMIEHNDKDRARYCRTVTAREWDWNDLRNYDLTFDTGKLGVDKCVDFIIDYLKLVGLLG
ncbi:MAG: cytidylate kinase-like family protein [Paludibacter sp.]|nr:cytidylate kinase-like family protein [Paludibacter sp.]